MKVIFEQLKYSVKVLMHPIDGFYELQFRQKGSVISATILLVLFYVCEVLEKLITNFVFNEYGLRGTSPIKLLIYTLVPLFIWILSNYLIGAITNGQGSLKAIYISTAYTLLPYILFSLPIAIVSNVLTNAEKSIYNFLYFLMVAFVAIMLFIQVKEIQGYEIFEAIRNIMLILFTAFLIVLFSIALYGIFLQSYNFLIEFFREVLAFD